MVIPASSLIRSSLNLSLRLFLIGRPFAPVVCPSSPSSSLLNIISGLLLIVAIEEAVFLRSSLLGDGNGGGASFEEVLRESHENGLVSFLVGGAGAGRDVGFDGGACGGGDHGTVGKEPDSPWRADIADFGGSGGGDFAASKSFLSACRPSGKKQQPYLVAARASLESSHHPRPD